MVQPVLTEKLSMHNYLHFLLLAVSAAACFSACSSSEIGNSKDVNPETVYTDYSVSYTEGEDSVNFYLQFRFAGENGTTLVLATPSKVTIDGNEIQVDSGSMAGAYYEKKFAAANINGDHSIVFTDINGKSHEEKFSFSRTACTTIMPASVNKQDFVFEFNNAANGNSIEIVLSDTSSATEDIHVNTKLNGNKLILSPAQLKLLKPGPIQIAIYKNQLIPLQQLTQQGGRFNINYSIKNINTVLED